MNIYFVKLMVVDIHIIILILFLSVTIPHAKCTNLPKSARQYHSHHPILPFSTFLGENMIFSA